MSLFSTSESWPRPLPLFITSKGPHLLPFLSTLPPSLTLDLVSSNQLLRGRHPIHQIYQVDSAAIVQPENVESVWNLRRVLNTSWHRVLLHLGHTLNL
ncbi:unnamed protein product [Brassica rapa]|uniref:Moybdenum cofactor oxidoreductase dimerisation domain-containing protein n=1 Tax=Brassica campestris TaxID=3711 RepID=A0A8D9DN02_BRACM|nr:unnamed protein product [Brassica rapa]